MGGVHQNPRTIIDKLPKAESIDSTKMNSFRLQTADLLQRFSEMNSTRLMTFNQPSAD